MTPHRLNQASQLPVEVAPVLGFAAVAAVMEHFVGLVDVLLVLVTLLWFVDMTGGTMRAMVKGAKGEYREGPSRRTDDRGIRGALDALEGERALEGIGKIVGIGMAVVVFGAFEILQKSVTENVYVPAVAPVLTIAAVFLSASILDQIVFFWRSFGERIRSFAREKLPGLEPDDGQK